MLIHDGVKVWGAPDEGALQQAIRCSKVGDVAGVALMADHHKGYSQPIGGVVAYRGMVSPSGVGYDIACGNKAVRTDLCVSAYDKGEIAREMDEIFRTISFGVGRKNANRVDHELFDDPTWADITELGALKKLAHDQLGTVGSGNHFVDLFIEEATDTLWVGCHFGSRGFGHKTATGFLNLAAGRPFDAKAPGEHMDQDPTLIPLDSELGQAYMAAMTLAGRYAYAGRDYVIRQVLNLLGAEPTFEVHNHHNFCIPGDAIIPTPSGPKRMAELRAGDVVYAVDQSAGLVQTAVTNQWCSGTKTVRSIRTSNRRLVVSDDHPILTVDVEPQPHPDRPWHTRGVGSFRWKKAREITPGDMLVCADGYYSTEQSLGIDKARLIGAMLGDGWLRHKPERSGYSVGLAIGGPDEAHTARYLDLLTRTLPMAAWKSNAPGAYGLTCSSVKVWRELQNLGVADYSNAKRVPASMFCAPSDEKLSLLAGYFDSDGSVSNDGTDNHGRGTIASTNRFLVEDLRELAIGCGLQITPVNTEHRETNFGSCVVFRCTFSADSMQHLDLWHEGKRQNLRGTLHQKPQGLDKEKIGYKELPSGLFVQRVRSIDISAEQEQVYDISVEHHSHSFVCEGVVVHNCWQEEHNGEKLVVVRKGATPCFPGQLGFVGGSMGDISVILRGKDTPEAKDSFYSTVHGAGRVMSRTQAAGKMNWKTRTRSGGLISPERMTEAVKAYGVELRGAGTDESPFVYRKLGDVLAAHGSVEVLHVLRPIGVAMAGGDEHDPYKD